VLDEVEGSAAHFLTSTLPRHLQQRLITKRDRYEEGVRQLIAAGIRSGELVPRDPALAARAMLGALNWSVLWFSPEGRLTAAEIADGFADYLIRGLLSKPDNLRCVRSTRGVQHAIQRQSPKEVKKHAVAW
jgi:AcrR family transcriptional regulator